MANKIQYIENVGGDHVFPVTHERGVFDDNGISIEPKLQHAQDLDDVLTTSKTYTTSDLLAMDTNNFTISSSTGNWGTSNTSKHLRIPINQGDIVYVTSNSSHNTSVAFFKSRIAASSGGTPDYATGWSTTQGIPAGKSARLVPPADAVIMYIYMGSAGSSLYLPTSLVIRSVSTERKDSPTTHFSITGNGNTLALGPTDMTQFIKGRTYRFTVQDWEVDEVTSSSTTLFAIASFDANDVATYLVQQFMGETRSDYYDVVIPNDSVSISVTLRANYGNVVNFVVEDITGIPEVTVARTENLLNPSEVSYGYYVSKSTGKLVSNSSYAASGFIPIDSRGLSCLDSYAGGSAIGFAYYSSPDESDYVGGNALTSSGTFIPMNSAGTATHVRMTLRMSQRNTGMWVVVPGATPGRPYTSYYQRQAAAFKDGSIPPRALNREVFLPNFNRGSITETYYGTVAELYIVAPNPGVIFLRHYNGKIYLRTFDKYAVSGATTYWECIQDDTAIVNGEIVTLYATTKSTTHEVNVGDVVGYVIFKDINTFRSTSSTAVCQPIDYAYCSDFRNSPIIYAWLQAHASFPTMEQGVEVILPAEIQVVQGDNLQLFYRSCITAVNPYNYDIQAISSVGKAYPKYYQFTPSASAVNKSYSLTISVKRSDGTIIASASTSLKVIAKPTSPESAKNILSIGASVMAGGEMMGEVNRRLTNTSGDGTYYNPTGLGLANINFVGRKTASGIHQEATGGWSWKDYATGERGQSYRFQITGASTVNPGDQYTASGVTFTINEVNLDDGTGNISCSFSGSGTLPASGTLTLSDGEGDATVTYTSYEVESGNPFWNNGALDFQNYADLYCNGSIDIIATITGINDIFSTRSIATTINYAKTFIRAYHTAFPDGKVVLANLYLPDITGGMGTSYGAKSLYQYFYIARRIFALAKEYNNIVADEEFSSYVSIAPTLQEFDSENSYYYNTTAVNNRSTKTWNRGINGVHPSTTSKYQFSDSFFAAISKLI